MIMSVRNGSYESMKIKSLLMDLVLRLGSRELTLVNWWVYWVWKKKSEGLVEI